MAAIRTASVDERVVLIETPIGRLEFGGNELHIISTVDDPPKVRMAAPTAGMGCISGNRLRADGVGEDEKILLILKDDTQEGYDVFQQQPGTSDDAGMRRLLSVGLAGVTAYVPLPPVTTVPRLISPNQGYVLNLQDDGNLVMYATGGSSDETTWRPVWQTGPQA